MVRLGFHEVPCGPEPRGLYKGYADIRPQLSDMAAVYHSADFERQLAHIRNLVGVQLAISNPTAMSHVWNNEDLKNQYIDIDNTLFEARKRYLEMRRTMNPTTPF